MLLGYNTNGFAHHRLEDALTILGELGYQSVAVTLDYHALNPSDPMLPQQLESVFNLLHRYRMRCVIETGSRFLLDPWRKHFPTLLCPDPDDRQRRFDFLCRAIDLASALCADAVSFWSGIASEQESADILMPRLVSECLRLCEYADSQNVRLGFEPEPGMFIDTMERFADLHRQVHHSRFGLTLDLGHLWCLGEVPISSHLLRWRDILWNIHIEDMNPGIHDHLPFGDGTMEFAPIFSTLREMGYIGPLHVELSRHSHDAVETARRALDFLRRFHGG